MPPQKVGKRMAQHLEKAIILHTFGVQVMPSSICGFRRYRAIIGNRV